MSQFQSTVAVVIEHDGLGNVALTACGRLVAKFYGDHKCPRTRRPFWAYTAEMALWPRRGTRKAGGEAVVAFAADLGIPREEARRVVNEALAHLGWPSLVEDDCPVRDARRDGVCTRNAYTGRRPDDG